MRAARRARQLLRDQRPVSLAECSYKAATRQYPVVVPPWCHGGLEGAWWRRNETERRGSWSESATTRPISRKWSFTRFGAETYATTCRRSDGSLEDLRERIAR